jgi:hypothetical protein
MPALQKEPTWAREVENVVVLGSVWGYAKGLISKVNVLEGKLGKARQAREVAEEKFHSLSNVSTDGTQWLVVSEMEHRE